MTNEQLARIIANANARNTLSNLAFIENQNNAAMINFCDGYVEGILDVLETLGYHVTRSADGYIIGAH